MGMHIHIIPNRNSTPAVLLRESYRVGGNVRKRTLANLSKLPMDAVDAIRRILKGEKLVSVEVAFKIVENGSRHHGHVDAVLSAMRQLGFEKLVGSRHSPERDLVVAMVVARILEPQSKLATSQWWHTTTLPEILGVSDAREDDLYAAMDWVLKRQEVIEKKLAARHLHNDGLALYDLTSSYFEGVSCPIARLGYDRDGKKGKLQINYGLLTNERGIPVSVSVFEGNTGDPKTLLPQVEKVQERFGIEQFVMVGDRGMITQTQIDELREMDGVDWITALRPEPIHKLINDGVLQMGLFDERNLFEVTHPDFPNERLVACRNPELAERRRHKRRALLEATCKELEKVCRMVERRRLQGKEDIRAAVKKLLNKYKVGRYYRLRSRSSSMRFRERAAPVWTAPTRRLEAPPSQGSRSRYWLPCYRTAHSNLVGNRFSPLEYSELDDSQRTMVRHILEGPRTAVRGPFNMLLRSAERVDPVRVLERKPRHDLGQQRSLSESLRQALIAQYRDHSGWSYQLHYENLEVLVEQDPSLGSMLGGSLLDGEDIVQDVLVQAFYKLPTLEDVTRLRPWLFRIAHNKCIDHLRRHRGVELVPVEEDELDVEAVEEPAIRVRVGEAFATLVTSLPPKERASVVLKDVLDYPLS